MATRRAPARRRTVRRRNPYVIPSHVVPKDAKKGDRVIFVEGRTVYFGFADADGSGNFEFRVAYGKAAKAYSTPSGAERAVAKWLTTGK